jgi:hypothetical protein
MFSVAAGCLGTQAALTGYLVLVVTTTDDTGTELTLNRELKVSLWCFHFAVPCPFPPVQHAGGHTQALGCACW